MGSALPDGESHGFVLGPGVPGSSEGGAGGESGLTWRNTIGAAFKAGEHGRESQNHLGWLSPAVHPALPHSLLNCPKVPHPRFLSTSRDDSTTALGSLLNAQPPFQ